MSKHVEGPREECPGCQEADRKAMEDSILLDAARTFMNTIDRMSAPVGHQEQRELSDRLRSYVEPDDTENDNETVRSLMVAAADEIDALRGRRDLERRVEQAEQRADHAEQAAELARRELEILRGATTYKLTDTESLDWPAVRSAASNIEILAFGKVPPSHDVNGNYQVAAKVCQQIDVIVAALKLSSKANHDRDQLASLVVKLCLENGHRPIVAAHEGLCGCEIAQKIVGGP